MNIALADQLITQGNYLEDNADFDNAINHYLQALANAPDYWRAYLNLGIAYNTKGELKTALEYLQKAYNANPNIHSTPYNLARTWYQLGQNTQQALQLLEKAVAIKPDFLDGWILLSVIQDENRQTELALKSINRVLSLEPRHFGALLNKIHYLNTLAKHNEQYEMEAYHLLKQLSPHDAGIRSLYGSFLRDRGYVSQAVDMLQKSYQFEQVSQFSSYLMTLLFSDKLTSESILEEHYKVNNFFTPKTYDKQIDLNQKIHIGFLSPDLYAHAVAYFIEPVLKHLNQNKFTISIYNISLKSDEITKQLKQAPVQWFDVQAVSYTI